MRLPTSTLPFLTPAMAVILAASSAAAVTPSDLAARISRSEPLLIVDVRGAAAYTEGHIPGAINIPLALLPHKPLPSTQPIIVYGDGLGVVDDARALQVTRAKPGVTADVLDGGYAGWVAETRLSTAAPGVTAEKVPGITYEQLVAAAKADVVLVDLRKPVAVASVSSVRKDEPARAAMTRDVVAEFAQKLGVPIMTSGGAASSLAKARTDGSGATPPRAAAPTAESESKSARLLVLVADNDAEANEAARQLRARGHYRFTVLIGGTESIRHEGRVGTGRMDGDLPVIPSRQ